MTSPNTLNGRLMHYILCKAANIRYKARLKKTSVSGVAGVQKRGEWELVFFSFLQQQQHKSKIYNIFLQK